MAPNASAFSTRRSASRRSTCRRASGCHRRHSGNAACAAVDGFVDLAYGRDRERLVGLARGRVDVVHDAAFGVAHPPVSQEEPGLEHPGPILSDQRHLCPLSVSAWLTMLAPAPAGRLVPHASLPELTLASVCLLAITEGRGHHDHDERRQRNLSGVHRSVDPAPRLHRAASLGSSCFGMATGTRRPAGRRRRAPPGCARLPGGCHRRRGVRHGRRSELGGDVGSAVPLSSLPRWWVPCEPTPEFVDRVGANRSARSGSTTRAPVTRSSPSARSTIW